MQAFRSRTRRALAGRILLLSLVSLTISEPSTAQTDADILIRTTSGVADMLAEMGVNLSPVRVYTGEGQKSLVAEVGVGGTTVYSDGNVGSIRGGVEGGKVAAGFGGTITNTTTNLTAIVNTPVQNSISGSTVGNATSSASSSSHASTISFSSGGPNL